MFDCNPPRRGPAPGQSIKDYLKPGRYTQLEAMPDREAAAAARADDLWRLARRVWCEGPADIDPISLPLDRFVWAMRRAEVSRRWWNGRLGAAGMDAAAYELRGDWLSAEERLEAFIALDPPPHHRLRAVEDLARIQRREPEDHGPDESYDYFADHCPPTDFTAGDLRRDLIEIYAWRRMRWSREQLADDDDPDRETYLAFLAGEFLDHLPTKYAEGVLLAAATFRDCLHKMADALSEATDIEMRGDLDAAVAYWRRYQTVCPCARFRRDTDGILARLDRKRRRLGLAS